MTFKLTIDCDNAAFDDAPKHAELVRILRAIADDLETRGGLVGNTLRDVNGNTVGTVKFR